MVGAMSRISGALRVKNEARWIADVLRSIEGVCDLGIVLFDDHSEDATREIAAGFASVEVVESPFSGLNEARDKDYLLQAIWSRAQAGDWCLMIDGDEVLATPDAEIIRKAAEEPDPAALSYSLRVLYLWDSPQQIRTDKGYGRFRRESMFKLVTPENRFRHKSGSSANFHCSNVPQAQRSACVNLPARLLHYGYIDREDRIRKFKFYNRTDPNNFIEDFYRHMVIGDLYPAESQFAHGGPLTIEPLVL